MPRSFWRAPDRRGLDPSLREGAPNSPMGGPTFHPAPFGQTLSPPDGRSRPCEAHAGFQREQELGPPAAPCRRLSAREPSKEPDETPRGPAEPARAPRNSPGPGGPLGIIPSRVRQRLPGGGADACAPALFGRPIAAVAAEQEAAAAAGAAGGAGRRGRGCLSAESLPAAVAATAARRGSRARRRKGRRPCAEGRRPQRRARLGRSRSAAEGGLQEIQTLRQEIGILTKHSRSRGRPAPGLPPRLTLWPRRHAGGVGGRRAPDIARRARRLDTRQPTSWPPDPRPCVRAGPVSGLLASSAPHSRPASSMLRCRRDRICPCQTLPWEVPF